MQTQDFNAESKAPRYLYQPSPVNNRAFVIMKKDDFTHAPEPVGDYTILDKAEDFALAEKKVMNLIALLNGRRKLMQLGHETNARVLYKITKEKDEENKMNVLFYQLEQQGVSKENALLRLERDKDVF